MSTPASTSFTRFDKLLALSISAVFGVTFVFTIQKVAPIPDFGTFFAISFAVTIALLGLALNTITDVKNSKLREAKIANVEKRFQEHPEKPERAWDLARVKLESYLDRNISQVRSIYWLTAIVMLFGFAFVMFGLYQAANDPQKLPMSIVSAASGVIISFVGGSFLLIFKSIMAQSREYVTVLERINAVGMAVQVIASIPESKSTLESESRAELAKQLLCLYGDQKKSETS